MKSLTTGYSDIFLVAERTARKYFRVYRAVLSPFQDVNDLIQESQIKVLETISRFPDKNKDEVFALCNQAVGWRLKNLVKKAKNEYYSSEASLEEPQDDNVVRYPVNLDSISFYLTAQENEGNFKFEELLSVLSQREYQVLFDIFKNKKTNESIAQEQNCSRQRINFIYKRAVSKARNYLNLN